MQKIRKHIERGSQRKKGERRAKRPPTHNRQVLSPSKNAVAFVLVDEFIAKRPMCWLELKHHVEHNNKTLDKVSAIQLNVMPLRLPKSFARNTVIPPVITKRIQPRPARIISVQ